jgi:hypothetical protein
MNLLPKIAVFYAVLWLVLWLLRRSPESLVSKIAFSWNGPFPNVGEKRSQFLRRQALYATSWLVQILMVAAMLMIMVTLLPSLKSSEVFQLVSAFALTIGAGMALVSAIYFAVASVKASALGPDPEFELADQGEPDVAEETDA